MNDTVFRSYRRLTLPQDNRYLKSAGGHPPLTATEHEHLAQRIAATDGVTPVEACQQIDQFRQTCVLPAAASNNSDTKPECSSDDLNSRGCML